MLASPHVLYAILPDATARSMMSIRLVENDQPFPRDPGHESLESVC